MVLASRLEGEVKVEMDIVVIVYLCSRFELAESEVSAERFRALGSVGSGTVVKLERVG